MDELDEDVDVGADHMDEVWEENDPLESDKERVLDFLKNNDSRPHQVGHVMSEALGHDVIDQANFMDMPEELPGDADLVSEGAPEDQKEKMMITILAQYQANRARVRNILEGLVYEGEIVRKDLPWVDVYGRPVDYASMSDDKVERQREHGSTETYYRYVGDSGN